VKPRLAKLTLISGCAVVVAAQAFAESPAPQAGPAAAPAATPPGAPRLLAAAPNARAASPVPVARFTAAGSVIVLADGIVANATIAQIHPPAPGFVYER
jgi:hypothetical protein